MSIKQIINIIGLSMIAALIITVIVLSCIVSSQSKTIAKYGSEWAFQYSEKEWDEWITRRPPYATPEVEIEVVR